MASYAPKAITASKTLGPSDAETLLSVSAAAGLTLTLPAATGSGYKYRVFIKTTVTSNNVVIQVTGDDVMQGLILCAQDAADTAVAWEAAADSDTITLNGTTKGGLRGDMFEFTDVDTDLWTVSGIMAGTGTEVTPFSAAVS